MYGRLLLIGALIAASAASSGQQVWAFDPPAASLVRDIHPTGDAEIGWITRVGDRAFFSARDGVHGPELWVTDGSHAGTRLVRDIRPGGPGSNPEFLRRAGDRVYFVAGDGSHGRELWTSDGTRSGTRMVRDLTPGIGRSLITPLAAVGDTFYFAREPAELWRTDGTSAGTRLVRHFDHSAWGPALAHGRWLYLRADDALWRTDGTHAGTVRITRRIEGMSDLAWFAGHLWFAGGVNDSDWCCATQYLDRTDGTRSGNHRFGDVVMPTNLTVTQGALWFNAHVPGAPYARVFRSDGTIEGTGPIRPRVRVMPGLESHLGSFWWGSRSGRSPWEDTLWRSDGTAGGAELVAGGDLTWFLDETSRQARFIALDGRIWFRASPGEIIDDSWTLTDEELWSSDGTPEGTVEAVDLLPDGSSHARPLVKLGSMLLVAADDGTHGNELWRVDP